MEPFVLQSDRGSEFANKIIIENLTEMWPGLKLVNEKPRRLYKANVRKRKAKGTKVKIAIYVEGLLKALMKSCLEARISLRLPDSTLKKTNI